MAVIQTGILAAGSIAAVGAAGFITMKLVKAKKTAKAIEAEFAACAETFSGLYEPLYLMSKEQMKYRSGILGDWATRTANLQKAPHYCEIWNKKLEGCTEWSREQGLVKLNELISFIQASGICRDTSSQIVVDHTTYGKYTTLEDDLIEAGQTAHVKYPYWYSGDKILEKGMIEKVI